jgi:Uma2 family endonuclease
LAIPDSDGVRISARTMYIPDALVDCGPRLPPDTLEILNPVIVVEVLSPTTAAYDQNDKIAGYFSLPSVMHYLVLNPDTRRGVHHKRGPGELIETRLSREGALRLDPAVRDGVEWATRAISRACARFSRCASTLPCYDL